MNHRNIKRPINEKAKIIDLSAHNGEDFILYKTGFQIEDGILSRKFVDYLDKCDNLISYVWSVKDDEFGNPIEGYPSTWTDGVWLWTTEYLHYLKLGTVGVPKGFFDHAFKNKFKQKIVLTDGQKILQNRYRKSRLLLRKRLFKLNESLKSNFFVLHTNFLEQEFKNTQEKMGNTHSITTFFEYKTFDSYTDAVNHSIATNEKSPSTECWILDRDKELVDYRVNETFLNETLKKKTFGKAAAFFIPARFKGPPR